MTIRWWCIFSVLIGLEVVWAADDTLNVQLTQAVAKGKEIKAYLNVKDSKGESPSALDPQRLAVSVGQRQALVDEAIPFANSGEGIAYIFLVDISKSLTKSQFKQITDSLISWIYKLDEDKDQAAVITFGSKVNTLVPFTSNQPKLHEVIKGLKQTDQNTQLYEGLREALLLGSGDNELPDRRVIITLSDGVDDVGKQREAIVEDLLADKVIQLIRKSHVPIYAIGFASTEENSKKVKRGMQNLTQFAVKSGGEFRDARGTSDLTQKYRDLRRNIREVFVVRATCDTCPSSVDAQQIKISVVEPRPLSPPAETVIETTEEVTELQWWQKPVIWAPSAGLIIVLLLGSTWFFFKDKLWRREGILAGAQQQPRAGTPSEKPKFQNKIQSIQFTVISGAVSGKKYRLSLKDSATVGRSARCDLVVADDPEISKQHFKLEQKGGRLVISDLNSTHGTFVNGIRLSEPRILEAGDKISMGRTELRMAINGEK